MVRGTLRFGFQFHAGSCHGMEDFSVFASRSKVGVPLSAVDAHAYKELEPIMTVGGTPHRPTIASRNPPSDPVAVDAAHALFGDLFEGVDVIIQVKGWGSGMRAEDDWGIFLNPTGAPDFSFDHSMRTLLLEMLRHLPDERTVVVQYDGDKMEAEQRAFSRFTLVLPALMRVLKEKACRVKAVLVTKLTDPRKAPEFANKCFHDNGGEEILKAADQEAHQTALYTVAFPTENAIDGSFRNAFGAYVNRALPEHLCKYILLFGGGKVIEQEMNEGYSSRTEIVMANVTRFNPRHEREERSPVIPRGKEAERLLIIPRGCDRSPHRRASPQL